MGSFTLLHWAFLLLALVSVPLLLIQVLAWGVRRLRHRPRAHDEPVPPALRPSGWVLILHSLTLMLFSTLLERSGSVGLAALGRLAGCVTLLWAIRLA